MRPGIVKGWCPGAHRPMASGDGLIVRVRPRLARLTADQGLGLCDLARRFGSGVIDLTSRANLQVRGLAEADHMPMLRGLAALDLLDADPELEARRNILIAPDWAGGDLTDRLWHALVKALPDLPDLPAKMGFAVDTGKAPILTDASADFRFERGAAGLILRADGADRGRAVTEDTAIPALTQMAEWFVATGGMAAGRMARHLATTSLPDDWTTDAPSPARRPLRPGATGLGPIYGAAFGQVRADALEALIRASGAAALRVTPWRLFLLEGALSVPAPDFVTDPDDPILTTHACAGAPLCPQAQIETQSLARRLAGHVKGTLHVSGCEKGCALPRSADITVTGRDGAYDLVRGGSPWDEPSLRGLTADALTDAIP